MAQLYLRNNVIWVRFTDNGKQILKSTGQKDTKDGWIAAKQLQKQIEVDVQRNVWNFSISKQKRIKFSDAIKLLNKSGTYHAASKIWLEQIGDTYIDAISITDIDKFKQYVLSNYSYATSVTYMNMIRCIYNYLIQQRYYNKPNPIEKLKQKQLPITTIPDNDFEKILNYISNNNIQAYRYIKLLSLTGLRVSEALDMNWDDIDFARNIMYIINTKANRIDSFPLYPELKDFLLSFACKTGKLFDYKDRFSLRFWARAKHKLKHDYSMHDIRRTFASKMSLKVMPYELMKLMRHQDLKVTMKHYIHVDMQSIIDKM